MFSFIVILMLNVVLGQRSCTNNGLLGPTGDKCYHFITTVQNFDDAEVVCGIFETVPVSITSGLESNFVLTNAQEKLQHEYWLGLTDLYNENTWRWMDGEITSYTNWATGFPQNDSSKRCVAAQWSGKWMNVECSSYSANLVCESVPPVEYGISKCPENGHEGLAGCYFINIVPETHRDAEMICGEFGGRLVEPLNAEQALNVMGLAKEHFYKTEHWIGISDPYQSGTWQFVDGTAINFTHWANGYPKSGNNSQCVLSRLSDGRWYNIACDLKRPSVCQQPFLEVPENPWIYDIKANAYYKGFRNIRGTWKEYEQQCVSEGAHLASIHSVHENVFVSSVVIANVSEYQAIGAFHNGSAIVWSDGTKLDYQFWGSKITAKDQCALQRSLNASLYWTYTACSTVDTWAFVCKKPRT